MSEGSLLPQHQRLLANSGIAPDVAAERGYRSGVSLEEVHALGFAPRQCRVPALLLPVRGPGGAVTLHQIRPDAPRRDRRGRLVKYETPAGARMGLDIPTRVRPVLGDPDIPL